MMGANVSLMGALKAGADASSAERPPLGDGDRPVDNDLVVSRDRLDAAKYRTLNEKCSLNLIQFMENEATLLGVICRSCMCPKLSPRRSLRNRQLSKSKIGLRSSATAAARSVANAPCRSVPWRAPLRAARRLSTFTPLATITSSLTTDLTPLRPLEGTSPAAARDG